MAQVCALGEGQEDVLDRLVGAVADEDFAIGRRLQDLGGRIVLADVGELGIARDRVRRTMFAAIAPTADAVLG